MPAIETIPTETIPVVDDAPETDTGGSEIPPIFGRCPVCKKPLRPRDRYTGEPKAPPIGQGTLSRAKCDRCGDDQIRLERSRVTPHFYWFQRNRSPTLAEQ